MGCYGYVTIPKHLMSLEALADEGPPPPLFAVLLQDAAVLRCQQGQESRGWRVSHDMVQKTPRGQTHLISLEDMKSPLFVFGFSCQCHTIWFVCLTIFKMVDVHARTGVCKYMNFQGKCWDLRSFIHPWLRLFFPSYYSFANNLQIKMWFVA